MAKTELSTAAKQARAAYKKQWREANKEHISEYQKEWHNREENKGKRAEYQRNYWENVAKAAEVTNGEN